MADFYLKIKEKVSFVNFDLLDKIIKKTHSLWEISQKLSTNIVYLSKFQCSFSIFGVLKCDELFITLLYPGGQTISLFTPFGAKIGPFLISSIDNQYQIATNNIY